MLMLASLVRTGLQGGRHGESAAQLFQLVVTLVVYSLFPITFLVLFFSLRRKQKAILNLGRVDSKNCDKVPLKFSTTFHILLEYWTKGSI